jgi:hypothetical protein
MAACRQIVDPKACPRSSGRCAPGGLVDTRRHARGGSADLVLEILLRRARQG